MAEMITPGPILLLKGVHGCRVTAVEFNVSSFTDNINDIKRFTAHLLQQKGQGICI